MAEGPPQHRHLIPGAAGTQLCLEAMLTVTSLVKNRRQRVSAVYTRAGAARGEGAHSG